MLKDRAHPLRPGGPLADPFEAPAPCARCGKMVDGAAMLLWRERRRLKLPSEAPGGFTYERRDHHHAVCPSCYGRLAEGGEMTEVRRWRGTLILLAAVVLALAVAAATPFVLPQLIAAFWQNGGAGR